MASTRREKELARLRAERQAARRAEAAAKRRQRNAIIASALAVVVVVAAVAFLVTRGSKDAKSTSAAGASPSTGAAAGPCTYTKSADASRPVDLPPATPTVTGTVDATMTTDQGVVTMSLDGAKAPCTTNALVSLASQKFYDGTPCRRLTSGGLNVLQCGDPTGTGTGGAGYSYAEEALDGATYPAGTVAMANTGAPASTGSQFFLVYKDSQLDPKYTPVGTITSGLDVLQKVAAAGSDPAGDGKPKLPINIKTFTTAPASAPAPGGDGSPAPGAAPSPPATSGAPAPTPTG